jgi:hypothetical protein
MLIVYADNKSTGNGWALINAKTKKEARKICYEDGWLENAKIVGMETFEKYCQDHKLSEQKIKELLDKVSKKSWYEIEWGS